MISEQEDIHCNFIPLEVHLSCLVYYFVHMVRGTPNPGGRQDLA